MSFHVLPWVWSNICVVCGGVVSPSTSGSGMKETCERPLLQGSWGWSLSTKGSVVGQIYQESRRARLFGQNELIAKLNGSNRGEMSWSTNPAWRWVSRPWTNSTESHTPSKPKTTRGIYRRQFSHVRVTALSSLSQMTSSKVVTVRAWLVTTRRAS